jgi:hypothetical protein
MAGAKKSSKKVAKKAVKSAKIVKKAAPTKATFPNIKALIKACMFGERPRGAKVKVYENGLVLVVGKREEILLNTCSLSGKASHDLATVLCALGLKAEVQGA